MPRVTGPRDARERLKLAAATAFAAKGFHATTTRDIAAAAGMSPAAVYVHHASKESLLYELTLVGHAEVLALAEAAVSDDASPTEHLTRLVRAWVRFHTDRHTVSRIVNFELDALTDEHLVEVARLRRRITDVFRDTVSAGVATGEMSTPHVGITSTALISLGVDVARWWSDDGDWTPDEVTEHMTALALRMVRPEAPPRGAEP